MQCRPYVWERLPRLVAQHYTTIALEGLMELLNCRIRRDGWCSALFGCYISQGPVSPLTIECQQSKRIGFLDCAYRVYDRCSSAREFQITSYEAYKKTHRTRWRCDTQSASFFGQCCWSYFPDGKNVPKNGRDQKTPFSYSIKQSAHFTFGYLPSFSGSTFIKIQVFLDSVKLNINHSGTLPTEMLPMWLWI